MASRSFAVDEYHIDSMVPVADIFNHKCAVVELGPNSEWTAYHNAFADDKDDDDDDDDYDDDDDEEEEEEEKRRPLRRGGRNRRID